MALEELLAILESEAASKVAAELASAAAEAERLTEESEARLVARRAAHRRTREAEVSLQAAVTLAHARHAARAELLVRRREMLDRVFAAASTQFSEIAGSAEFMTALARHFNEAHCYVGGGRVTVQCRPELESAVRALAGRHGLGVELVCGGAWGIRLIDHETGIEIDNTLESRLERLRNRLAIELARMVEGDDHAGLG
jgi:vacuolar-type H+-ATPase subunit E/Vma4